MNNADLKSFCTYLEIKEIERKLTNSQIEYLNQCKCTRYLIFLEIQLYFLDYARNNNPPDEELANQWNKEDSTLFLNLDVSRDQDLR